MKIPVIIEIVDKTQQRPFNDNTVTVRILATDTRLPFFQFECNRQELCRAASSKKCGGLDGAKMDGHMTT